MSSKPERLRTARIKAGYDTARAAAEAMGIKPATYIHHENGTRDYKDRQAQQYARKFKVSPQWLLYGLAENPNKGPIPQPIVIQPTAPLQTVSIRALQMASTELAQMGIIRVDDTTKFTATMTDVCLHIDRYNITDPSEIRALLRFAMRTNVAEMKPGIQQNT